MRKIRFIDLFCGIGGFHHAMQQAATDLGIGSECVFASDIDEKCRVSYEKNFGLIPTGDITAIKPMDIPDHDILLGGFPCQAFSIIGDRKGFKDTRGTLFFNIAKILAAKKPQGFVLENVKQLVGHDRGKTLKTIMKSCANLGYDVRVGVLNALDFGVPQKRERVFIVGWNNNIEFDFEFDLSGFGKITLSDILEKNPDHGYFASAKIREAREKNHKPGQVSHGRPTIWHENKSGNISAYEYSCALRAGASYNYLLVDGKRRLTEREMLRLQGFPEYHKIIGSYSDLRKQTGNALPVPVACAVITRLLEKNLIGGDHGNEAENPASIGNQAALSA